MDEKLRVIRPENVMQSLAQGLLYPLAVLIVLIAVDWLAGKSKNKLVHATAIMLVLVGTAFSFTAFGNITGSTAVWYLATAFSMTAVIFILKFFRYTPLDYVVFFAGFVCIKRWPSYTALYFGEAVPSLCIFGMVLAITKIRFGTLKGRLFYVWFISLFTSFEGYVLGYLYDYHVRHIGYMFNSWVAKAFVWGAGTFVAVLFNLALIYGIKRIFDRRFNIVNDMGRRYPHIERYFIYSTIIILAAVSAVHFIFKLNDYTADYSLLFNIFTLFALTIQLSFLIMLFRFTWLRDSLKIKDRENMNLAAYSSGLEKNIDDIRNLKHDIKNIFLTMANFVEKSDDEDMKTFYREKISPFAEDEIQKNDLYAKLSKIGEERLKAFLFYKISQIIERGIALELEIAPYFKSETCLEFTDLIRILGILLDNAAEECMELQDGVINVKLSLNDELVSYTIRNSVRPETRDKGIRPGVSSKGNERGRGLVIVRDIIGKYENVMLNSYFARDGFVQGLVCYR